MARGLARFDEWPTGAKLLLLLTLVLLPLGMVVTWAATDALREASRAKVERSEQQGRNAALAIESLIARNALALRVAANGALRGQGDPCALTAASLALTPGIASRFVLRSSSGDLLCAHGGAEPTAPDLLVAPGDVRLWDAPERSAVNYRVGVMGGMATGDLSTREMAAELRAADTTLRGVHVLDAESELPVLTERASAPADQQRLTRTYPIANGQLRVRVVTETGAIETPERLAILLPVAMWGLATLLSWFLVKRLLILPLARLQRAVVAYQPGDAEFEAPDKLGTTTEIQELCLAFERAIERIGQSERETVSALEGQRRLVREVHHRVKNNLQVVASLLNIHGRSAQSPEAGAAYAAIGRRVEALSVVHRNHFADVEESRGIALHPLLVELAATLRASAPNEARSLAIIVDADHLHTTQDAAVSVAFFVTEIVEFAMLRDPKQAVEVELRRFSELAARLTLSSQALVGDGAGGDLERQQFDRVVGGLARQLRSPLDDRVGRLSVDVPVFPT